MSKYFKIYGTNYELSQSTDAPPDAFAFKNQVFDDPPVKAKSVGFVTMEDGSTVQCFTKFNPLLVIIPTTLVVTSALAGAVYLMYLQPKDVNVSDGLIVTTGDDRDVISYNGFMSIKDNTVDLDFTNGTEPAVITITGDGITCEPVNVEADSTITDLPITYDTDEALINATLTIKTATSTSVNQVVIEVPENMTPSSPTDGLDGYWKGEAVYGIE